MTSFAYEDARTYAVVARPLPDEALIGMVFRLDDLNGVPPLSVARDVAVAGGDVGSLPGASWASGSGIDLPVLASRTGNPLEAIDRLTFMPALRGLTGRADPSIRTLGPVPRPRLCPVCWRTRRLIRRSHLLPLIIGCPEHGCRLVGRCPCGRSRQLLDLAPDQREFACRAYGTRWDDLKAEPLSEDERRRDFDLHVAYASFLGLGPVDFRRRGIRVFEVATATRRRIRGHRLPTRRHMGNVSVARMVELFLAYSVDPRLVAELLEDDAPPKGCPNATCPYFVPRPQGRSADPLAADVRDTHCHHCGARFQGRRIISCFDLDHDGDDGLPCRATVRRAQRRLRIWQRALRAVSRDLLERDEPITVGDAFRLAGIPKNANLRATRLGLVDIVSDAARRRRLLRGEEPSSHAAETSMERYGRLRQALRARHSDPSSLDRVRAPRLQTGATLPRGRRPQARLAGLVGPLYPLTELMTMMEREGSSVVQSRVIWLRARWGDDLLGHPWVTAARKATGMAQAPRPSVVPRADRSRVRDLLSDQAVSVADAEEHLVSARWRSGAGCARCGHPIFRPVAGRDAKVMCVRCWYQQSATSETLLHHTRLDARTWVLLVRAAVALGGITCRDVPEAGLVKGLPSARKALRTLRSAMARALEGPLVEEVIAGFAPSGGPAFASADGIGAGWPLLVLSETGTSRVRLVRLGRHCELDDALAIHVEHGARITASSVGLARRLLRADHPFVSLDPRRRPDSDAIDSEFQTWWKHGHRRASNGIEPFLAEFAFYREFPSSEAAEAALLRALVTPLKESRRRGA